MNLEWFEDCFFFLPKNDYYFTRIIGYKICMGIANYNVLHETYIMGVSLYDHSTAW